LDLKKKLSLSLQKIPAWANNGGKANSSPTTTIAAQADRQ